MMEITDFLDQNAPDSTTTTTRSVAAMKKPRVAKVILN